MSVREWSRGEHYSYPLQPQIPLAWTLLETQCNN